LKPYGSASRRALGQPRSIAASAVLGTLSLGLVGAGIAALVAPHDGVATASLTADRAPRVIAWDGTSPADGALALAEASKKVAPLAEDFADNDEGPELSLADASADEPDSHAIRHTASIADPGLFEPLTEERLEAEAAALPVEPQPV